MKNSFTLIELLISITIISLLIVLVFKVYMQLSDISIRIENEKILNNEILFLSQNLQNLSDKNNINFNRYSDLKSTYGLSWTLFLNWTDGNVSVYSTWDCIDDVVAIKSKYCWIQINKNWNIYDLTDKNKIYFTKFYFKILPYADPSQNDLTFDEINHNWFWIFAQSYIKKYNESKWPFNVMINSQSFFNIRKY